MKARAQVLTGPEEFELRELDVPDPGPGELRMRVHACGICGSDKVLAQVAPAGTVLGHEVVAEVEARGPGVRDWQVGERGIPIGDHLGMGEDGRSGGFSDLILVSADSCVRVPRALPSLEAVLAEPLGNGLHFVGRGRLHAGQRVAILGAGQIGLSILYWARRFGAGRIVVSEPTPARAQLARELGADVVLDPSSQESMGKTITEALGGRPEIVFEATGRPAVMRDAVRMVGGGGGVVVLSGITLEEIAIRPASLCLKETDLVFPLGTVKEEVEEVVAVLAGREFPAERFISHRIEQAAIPAALRDLGAPRDQIKVVVDYIG